MHYTRFRQALSPSLGIAMIRPAGAVGDYYRNRRETRKGSRARPSRDRQPDAVTATRYFDDLAEGERFVTGEWALDEAEIVAFARAFDPQPIHVDAAGAAEGPYGGLIASGFQTMALGFRLFYELGVINRGLHRWAGHR